MEVNQVMGATGPPLVLGSKSILEYPGIKFIFEQDTLAKLKIFKDEFLAESIAESLCYKTC